MMNALSPQQLEVAKHVAKGCNNLEISLSMGITEQTVKNYLTLIFDRVGVRDRLQLGLWLLNQKGSEQ
jgi:two-component system nitrate/nitrite response regulator NarL